MGGLRGVPEDLAGFGAEAVGFAIESTTEGATDPIESTSTAGEAIAGLEDVQLGGLEVDTTVEKSGVFSRDQALAIVTVLGLVTAYLLWREA